MAEIKNVGNYDAGAFVMKGASVNDGARFTMDAAGIQSGGAFLVSELEKRDPMIRKPLSSFTYGRDIPISVGGGWADYVSAMSVAYGITGGSGASPITAGGANGVPIVQASYDKGIFKAHTFAAALRVMFQDMQRANFVGRSLDQTLSDGVRLTYDKHMGQNVYAGFSEYGTTGLINNALVTETLAAATGTSSTRTWSTKTADNILADINKAIVDAWKAAEYDLDAIPNHILIPYEQYTYIATTKVSDLATMTILEFLLQNNIAAKNGADLFIGATRWCDGAGVDSSDRMVVYCNKERYVREEELVPLSRIMSAPNVANVCYDTAYMANISEVEVFYPQTMLYVDGI